VTKPCKCHSSDLYASLDTCPKCGHKSLDVVKEWIDGKVLKITYEGCERRKCGYERVAE
jgi:hypothetical protein